MKPTEDRPPPSEEAMERVEKGLAEEPVLAWRPELTQCVLARIRRERLRSRVGFAAAVILIAVVASAGALVLKAQPAVAEVTGWVADRAPSLPSASEVFDSLSRSASRIADVPGDGGAAALPLAIAALVLLVTLNSIVVARPLAARRKPR